MRKIALAAAVAVSALSLAACSEGTQDTAEATADSMAADTEAVAEDAMAETDAMADDAMVGAEEAAVDAEATMQKAKPKPKQLSTKSALQITNKKGGTDWCRPFCMHAVRTVRKQVQPPEPYCAFA